MSNDPDLKGTLGALLRTTLGHAGALRTAFEKEASTAREWLDQTLAARHKRDKLVELGQVTFDLATRGELGALDDYPEIANAVAAVEAALSEEAEPRTPAPPREPTPVWRPVGGAEEQSTSFVDDPVEDDDDLAAYMHEDDVPPPESGS